MTLIEEIKDIINSRPKHRNKIVKKAEKENTYKDIKSMRHGSKTSIYPKSKGYQLALIVMSLIASAFLAMLIIVDILPGDLTLMLVVIMIVMLLACSILFASKLKRKRVCGIALAVIFCLLFSTTVSYMASTYKMFNSISDTDIRATGPAAKYVDVTQEPFNVYITGIDQWESEKGQDLERSDVNMIVTVNPETKEVLMTSIPRDSYVKLHTAQQMDKLTHTGIYGVEETLQTVEDWLGIHLNYYVKINFSGARNIITAMGGIEVYSPVDFTSSIMGYEYKKGINKLNGKEALYFARERKAFEGQDAMRVENQQRVMQAIIKKLTSSTVLLTAYGEILDAAGENMSTNMSSKEIMELIKMQITDLSEWNISSQKIEGEFGEDYVASMSQRQKYSIYRTDDSSVKNCVAEMDCIMNPTEDEVRESQKNRSKSFLVNAGKRLFAEKSREE